MIVHAKIIFMLYHYHTWSLENYFQTSFKLKKNTQEIVKGILSIQYTWNSYAKYLNFFFNT